MSLQAVPAHELTAVRVCRVPSCPNEAASLSPRMGRYANLCEEHHRLEAAKNAQQTRERSQRFRESRRPARGQAVGFEARARELVAVGRALDKATASFKPIAAKYEPARRELEAAMAEWRAAVERLAAAPQEQPKPGRVGRL